MSKATKLGLMFVGGIILTLGAWQVNKKIKQRIPAYWWIELLKQEKIVVNEKVQPLSRFSILDVWEYEINDNLARLTVLIEGYKRFFLYEIVWDKEMVSDINEVNGDNYEQAITEYAFKEISDYEARKWRNDSNLGI